MHPIYRHSYWAVFLYLSVLTPAFAQDNSSNQVMIENSIPYLSGGVGDVSMDELIARQSEFDLKLFFVNQSGAYLSDIDISIADASRNVVLKTTSEGPVLLAKLPSGDYSIQAQNIGQTLVQKISITATKLQTAYFRFSGE